MVEFEHADCMRQRVGLLDQFGTGIDLSKAFVHVLERTQQLPGFVPRLHLDAGGEVAVCDALDNAYGLSMRTAFKSPLRINRERGLGCCIYAWLTQIPCRSNPFRRST